VLVQQQNQHLHILCCGIETVKGEELVHLVEE